MNKILEIIKETDWTRLGVEVDDHGNIIKDTFKHKHEFLHYLVHNLSKYDVTYLGHELVENEENELNIIFKFAYLSKTKILSNTYITELADDIMLELTDDEIADIKKTESLIREKFLKVLTIDTQKVKPLYFATDETHTYLREDDEYHVSDHEAVLKNAPSVDGDYITLVKVVK